MSASLIVLLPVALLAIVSVLCFVGCTLPLEGLPATPFTEYSSKTVLLDPAIIAYWPLNDKLKNTDNPAPAVELASNIPSSYIDMTTAPELYPWLPFPVKGPPPEPDVQSDGAPGTIAFNEPGLVKGDAVVPAIPSFIQPCVVVNGCYVEAPFNPKFVPQGSFTVEAWVRVGWTAGDLHALRFVLDMRDLNPGRGFGLFAKAEDNQPGVYRWAGIVGTGNSGSAAFKVLSSNEFTISLSSPGSPPNPVHLALTFDGATLTLFVNGGSAGSMTATYMPNTAQPLWIGAGAPYVTRRSAQMPAGTFGSPLFPFKGSIQDVAIYSAALKPDDIFRHFNNGNGTDPPQP